MGDENAVTFRRRQAQRFKIIRAAVEHYIAAHHAAAPTGVGDPDIPEQIEKLDELRDQELITEEEFESKTAQLLDRL